jgi:hypothetical protein
MSRPSLRLALASAAVLLAAAGAVEACSVPVFRVALLDRRWRPEPYEFTLFHKGPLTAADQAILKGFNDYLDKNESHVNCVLEVIDLDKTTDKDTLELFKQQGDVPLPYLVVRHPDAQDVKPNLWSGPLQEAPLRALFESTARAELGKRLLAGESAVWVLIECGDQAKDQAAHNLLTKQLRELERTLTLPEPKEEDIKRLQRPNAPPLKLAFSTLRLSRTGPAEKWLVEMLLGMEGDLKAAREPIVFPVYGRGVALYALVGKGINAEQIAKAAEFLVGECSCEVRRLNPGKDLLMTAAWETGEELPAVANLLYAPAAPAPAPKTKAPAGGTVIVENSASRHEESSYESETSVCCGELIPWLTAAGGLAVGLLAVVGVGAFLLVRGKGA